MEGLGVALPTLDIRLNKCCELRQRFLPTQLAHFYGNGFGDAGLRTPSVPREFESLGTALDRRVYNRRMSRARGADLVVDDQLK